MGNNSQKQEQQPKQDISGLATYKTLKNMGFDASVAQNASQKYPRNIDNALLYANTLQLQNKKQIAQHKKQMSQRYQVMQASITSNSRLSSTPSIQKIPRKKSKQKVSKEGEEEKKPKISKAKLRANQRKIKNFKHEINVNIAYKKPAKQQKESKEGEEGKKAFSEPLEFRQTAFEYLLLSYILEIRQKDNKQYLQYLNQIEKFKQLIKMYSSYCIIDDDIFISFSMLDDIFINRFCQPFNNKNNINSFNSFNSSFNFLLKAYQRCIDFELKQIKLNWTYIIPTNIQYDILISLKTFICKYACLILSTSAITNNDDFQKSQHQFRHLLTQPIKGREFPKGFLPKLFEEECSVRDILGNVIKMVQTSVYNVRKSNYRQSLDVLLKLSSVEQFVMYLIEDANLFWLPNKSIKQIKEAQHINGINVKKSILGGLLCLGFETADVSTMFDEIQIENYANMQSMQLKTKYILDDYRFIINDVQNGIYQILNNMLRVKKNKLIRKSIVKLLSYFIYINLDRAKSRFDQTTVASDSFLLNLNFILLKLFEPIIDKNLLHKLDSRYFLLNKYDNFMSWENSGRLGCDSEQLILIKEILYNDPESVVFGFSTKIFCLTLESLHIGFAPIMKEILTMSDQLRQLQPDRLLNDPFFKMLISKVRLKLLSRVAHIDDPRLMQMIGAFYGYFCKYLLYLSGDKTLKHEMNTIAAANNTKYNMNDVKEEQEEEKEIKIDEKHETPSLLSIIPEYYIEDMIIFFRAYLTDDYCISLMKYGKCAFNRKEVIKCLLYLLGDKTPIRNIYHRSSLSEILLYFLPVDVQKSFVKKSILWKAETFAGHEYNQFDSCKKGLVGTLLILYTHVEKSGFYEKFQFRTHIAKILKFLFSYKVHRDNLLIFWKDQKEKFIGFLNVLINDLIYALDHGFDGIKEIKQSEYEQKMQQQPGAQPIEFGNLNDMNFMNLLNPNRNNQEDEKKNDRQREETMLQTKHKVRLFMNLANQSIELLQFVCKNVSQAFLNDLILPRIAVLICVYIDKLSHGSELRVKDNLREHYNFNAKYLLISIVEIFNKLCENNENEEKFLNAIVEDEIHFKQLSYSKAINILRKKNLMNFNDINLFENKLNLLLKKIVQQKNIQHILGDIPSKYLDPIMQTIMTDPVILSSSSKNNENEINDEGNVYIMDRKVIERHLMNQQNNPFNRQPLTKNDLIPHTKLKNEIQKWKKEKLKNYRMK